VLGPTVVIIGSVSADEDLFIHGTLRGHLAAPDHCVRLEAEAHVDADVLARDVTMLGEATGKFTATEIVDIRNGADRRAAARARRRWHRERQGRDPQRRRRRACGAVPQAEVVAFAALRRRRPPPNHPHLGGGARGRPETACPRRWLTS
jgi:hypothetical protein